MQLITFEVMDIETIKECAYAIVEPVLGAGDYSTLTVQKFTDSQEGKKFDSDTIHWTFAILVQEKVLGVKMTTEGITKNGNSDIIPSFMLNIKYKGLQKSAAIAEIETLLEFNWKEYKIFEEQ